MHETFSPSTSSYQTRRRARLRRFAKHRKVGEALALFACVTNAASTLSCSLGAKLRQSNETSKQPANLRDLLPLPQVDRLSFRLPLDTVRMTSSLLFKLINASSVGLNHLHGGSGMSSPRVTPNRAQQAALTNLALSWWRLGAHLANYSSILAYLPSCYRDLVGRKASSGAAPLVASKVDSLSKCSQVDASAFLPSELREVVECPARLILASGSQLNPTVRFSGGSRYEYARLLRRQCRSQKIVFSRKCSNASDIFFLRKPATGALREVWNGKCLSEVSATPPSPPWLSTPTCLGALECSDDETLWISTRDGACFFDQLQVPYDLRSYLGKPFVRVNELLGGDACNDPLYGPLTIAELRGALVDADVDSLAPEDILTPLLTCWPMGHRWSSTVSQHVMTKSCFRAGFTRHQLLCDENGLPAPSGPVLSVATDDLILFERSARARINPGSTADGFRRLDAEWNKSGIISKDSKRCDRASDGVALGLSLVRGKYLMPKEKRLFEITCGHIHLLTVRETTPQEFGIFFGVLQWVLLARRPLLACCGAIYAFIDDQDTQRKVIPSRVLSELALVGILLCYLVIDLRAPWSPFITATDGAEEFGYGGAQAACSPSVVRGLAAQAHVIDHSFVTNDCDQTMAKNCLENRIVMPLSGKDFRTTFSIKSAQRFHASKLDIGAVGLAVRFMVRRPRCHRMRTLFLVDAQALLHAARKGRSSAPNFAHGMKVISALALAADVRLHFGYIPTFCNPGVAPSRGQRRRATQTVSKRKRGVARPSSVLQYVHELKRSLRRCRKCGTISDSEFDLSWDSSCSSSCCTQPSETSSI